MNNYKPWIHNNVINLLENIVKKDTKILEFGSGYSTLFLQNKTTNLTSIEHNIEWYNNIKNKLNKNVNYILKQENYISKLPDNKKFYSCETLKELVGSDIPDDYYDIIFVDGINRVNCVLGTYKKLKKGGYLILDDSNRIDNPASDGSYKLIQDLLKDWIHIKHRSNNRNTDYWIKN